VHYTSDSRSTGLEGQSWLAKAGSSVASLIGEKGGQCRPNVEIVDPTPTHEHRRMRLAWKLSVEHVSLSNSL
jgi:hypothetical protein